MEYLKDNRYLNTKFIYNLYTERKVFVRLDSVVPNLFQSFVRVRQEYILPPVL